MFQVAESQKIFLISGIKDKLNSIIKFNNILNCNTIWTNEQKYNNKSIEQYT
jgi:hypothetical protein